MRCKSLKRKASSDVEHGQSRSQRKEQGGRVGRSTCAGRYTQPTPLTPTRYPQWSDAKCLPVPKFSFLVRVWSVLSLSGCLFKEGLLEITTCIYRAIITHHHLVHAEHRESHSIWMVSLYFKLMGAPRPESGLFNGS